MFELILITSLCLILIDRKLTNKMIPIAIRALQIIISSYCIYKNNMGPSANILGSESVSTLLFFLVSVLFSFDIERLKYRRYFKELLFLLTAIIITTNSLPVVVVTTLFVITIFISKRRKYFIDYISLFLLSLISLIYFSELSTTVLTVKDSYFLYLTEVSEMIFYPLIVLFVFVEFCRLWGMKRDVSTILTVVPLIFAYKFKLANSFEQDLSMLVGSLYLIYILMMARKVLNSKSIKESLKYLLSISLFTSFAYFTLGKYETSLTFTLSLMFIFTLYREAMNFFSNETEVKKVITFFSLINLSAIPLSFSGLGIIDALSLAGGPAVFSYLIIAMIASVITLAFTLKKYGDDLFVNLLEGTSKVKVVTVILFITSLMLIFSNLSQYLANKNNVMRLESLLFGSQFDMIKNTGFNYNLIFILFLIGVIVIGYLVRNISDKLSWRVAFNFDEAIRSISLKEIKVKQAALKENSVESVVKNERSEIEISSFKVSFLILTTFLIISLVIIEL